MGITYVEGVVTGPAGKQATVRFLVDSGATYTLLPHKDWQLIGLLPKRSVTFTLADGTTIERKVSECHIQLPQGDGHTRGERVRQETHRADVTRGWFRR